MASEETAILTNGVAAHGRFSGRDVLRQERQHAVLCLGAAHVSVTDEHDIVAAYVVVESRADASRR